MSKKAERQLKELRSLMPWNWDARVEEHPPGEKAMHDFEDVLNYQIEQRSRRVIKHASPIAAAKTKAAPTKNRINQQQPITKPRLSPDNGIDQGNAIIPGPESDRAIQCKAASTEVTAAHSTARHPPTDDDVISERARTQKENISPNNYAHSPPEEATPAVVRSKPNAAINNNPSTTHAAGGFHRHHHDDTETPNSRLPLGGHFSEHRPALADGQFQPTPMPTPNTVIGTNPSRHGGQHAAQHAFRSPPPRTIFAAAKKRRTSSSSKQQQRQQQQHRINNGSADADDNDNDDIPMPATSSAIVPRAPRSTTTTITTTTTATKAAKIHANTTLRAPNPPIPSTKRKGARTQLARPVVTGPIDISFLKNNSENENKTGDRYEVDDCALENGDDDTDTRAAVAMQYLSTPMPMRDPTAMDVGDAKKRSSGPTSTALKQRKRKKQQQEQHMLDEEAKAIVKKFGRGPYIQKPASCPPLFKSQSTHRQHGKVVCLTQPPISEYKRMESRLFNEQMYSYERSLLAFLSLGSAASNPNSLPSLPPTNTAAITTPAAENGRGMEQQKYQHAAAMASNVMVNNNTVSVDAAALPPPSAGDVGGPPSYGMSLAWACSTLKALQNMKSSV